ncbi:MAG TPA: hypothetical protein EYN66_06580 [Myxococcales bacterium]|nr:hypothetical protein [Myxococcales bacterium]
MGFFLFDMGLHEKALAHYNHAVELMPSAAITYLSLAKVQTHLGRLKSALSTVEKGLTNNPTSARLMVLEARIRLRLGQVKVATSLTTKALKQDPGLLGARILRADCALAAGDESSRLRGVTQLLDERNDPTRKLTAIRNHSEALAGRGRIKAAHALLQQGVNLAVTAGIIGSGTRMLTYSALIERLLGRPQQQLAIADKLDQLLIAPELSVADRGFAIIYSRSIRAEALFRLGKITQGNAILNRLEAMADGKFFFAKKKDMLAMARGFSLAATGKFDPADKVVAESASNPCQVLHVRARLRLQQGNKKAATSMFDALLNGPNRCANQYGVRAIAYIDALVQRAALSLDANQPKDAARRLQEARKRWSQADPELSIIKKMQKLQAQLDTM